MQVVKAMEALSYDRTVFKVKWGKSDAQDLRREGGRVLRIEVVAHNVKDLRGGWTS
jgi:hypothetical protein